MDDPDAPLVDALRAGDEAAFRALVERYHARLLRLAQSFVPSRAVAEEVVQDTWLGVVRGIDRYEGRAPVRSWLFGILANRARSAGAREARTVPFGDDDPLEGRFDDRGHWAGPVEPWADAVDERLDAGRLARLVHDNLVKLPPSQRQVLVLRDIEGVDAAEVCELLGVSPANQRVLHRGRTRLRALLDTQMERS